MSKNEIFISYRWKDKESDEKFELFVRSIEKITGVNVFWDSRELRSGDYLDKLREAVASCYVFMPVVTESYIKFGTRDGQDNKRDYCLWEYANAVLAGKRIVPVLAVPDSAKPDVTHEQALNAAPDALAPPYSDEVIEILQTYILRQNGINVGRINRDRIEEQSGRLFELVFDTFCKAQYEVPFFKDHLNKRSAELNPVWLFGDYDDRRLTLENSYVPISFLRHLTESERQEKEQRRESTAPTDATEEALLSALEKERLAVVVGDAGQGKSSFAKHVAIESANKALKYGLSRDLFFPIYLECKNIRSDSFSDQNSFLDRLAECMKLRRTALDAVMRFGKPLFIFDAMDEIPPEQMDRLLEAIFRHLYNTDKKPHILFTTRPGQKSVAGQTDMTLNHKPDTAVRRYSIKEFDEKQRDSYIEKLAAANNADDNTKLAFIDALKTKENEIADYRTISRNPFMLFAVFSTYARGQDLPANRFDAICRVIDDIIRRDLGKGDYRSINAGDIKDILGAVAFSLYQQRDQGKPSAFGRNTLESCAKKICESKSQPEKLPKCIDFFSESKLVDENGFQHEFLASTYAAYYLVLVIKKIKSPQKIKEFSELISKDTDYWKSVKEAILCLLDREISQSEDIDPLGVLDSTSEDSKLYIESLLSEMQNTPQPDYDTFCSAVSQFTNHQTRAAAVLLSGMLERGCDGIITGEQTEEGFICRKGVNPYEELFYYPAVYPVFQKYLPNLTAEGKQEEEYYLCNELIKEVCVLFEEGYYKNLQNVYNDRNTSAYPDINAKLADAADRRGWNLRGHVRIRDGETEIYSFTFCNCTGLTSIIIPDSVTKIGMTAFKDCIGLKNITIPNGVARIEDFAFFGCTGLTSITIPNSTAEIGEGVFSDCTGLTSIIVDKNNTNYASIDGALFIKNKTTICIFPAGKKGEYSIPNTVTVIGERTFSGCTDLTSITIPDSVTEICSFAFSSCSGLTSITVPNSVTKIGWNIFSGCTGLQSISIHDGWISTNMSILFSDCPGLKNIIVSKNSIIYSSEDGVLFNKEKTSIILFPQGKTGSYTIPDRVTRIGMYAFYRCTGLTSITIPKSVNSIGERAFSSCSGLTSITIPDSVTIINEWTFFNCTGLTSIFIPDSVIKIERAAFSYCTNLTIHGKKGSYAEGYARENKIPFEPLP